MLEDFVSCYGRALVHCGLYRLYKNVITTMTCIAIAYIYAFKIYTTCYISRLHILRDFDVIPVLRNTPPDTRVHACRRKDGYLNAVSTRFACAGDEN